MKLVLLLFISFMPLIVHAQKESIYSFKVGYYGNNGHNSGLVVGAVYRLFESEKFKHNLFDWDQKELRGYKQLWLDCDAGFFVDWGSFTGIFVTSGFKFVRKYLNGSNYHLVFSPISFFRSSFVETYEVLDGGDVKKVFLPGRNYYAPTFTMGIGAGLNKKKLDAWYLDVESTLLSRYNASVLPLIAIEFGYRFDLNFN